MNKNIIFSFVVLTVLLLGLGSTSNVNAIAKGPFSGPQINLQNVNSTNATATNSTNATATNSTNATATNSTNATATNSTNATATNSTNATATNSTNATATNSTNATATNSTNATATNSTNATATNSTNATATNSTNATEHSHTVPVLSAQFTTSSTNSSKQVLIAAGVAAEGSNGICVTQNNCFNPHMVNVTTGQNVTWANNDNTIHTVTSGKPSSSNIGKLFDKSVSPGKSVSITFNNTGTINYFCKVHPWMTGQVIVENTHAHSGTNTHHTSNSNSGTNTSQNRTSSQNSNNTQGGILTTSSSNKTHS